MVALTFSEVLDRADTTYPAKYLEGCDTAFMGFCAAFMGQQDCVWAAEAGLTATCVDIDGRNLERMQNVYPDYWTFIRGDAFDVACELYEDGARFDVVSLDPFSNLFQRVADETETWCSLARKVVILGTNRLTDIEPPEGWVERDRVFRSRRFHGAYWTVLEHEG